MSEARRVQRRRDLPGVAHLSALTPLPSASERAAGEIREQIFEGHFLPGTALPEVHLADALRVSRNTIREALRALTAEHLVRHEPHRGVTVRSLTPLDVRDIYAGRRMLELGAIDGLATGERALPDDAFAACLEAGDRAAAAGNWRAAGTANLRFHAELVAVHRSVRLDEFFGRLMTEMRLGFLALADPRGFHEPYLRRNHDLATLLRGNRFREARIALARYLDDSARQVVAAVEAAGA